MSECMTQEDAMNMSNEQAVAILKPLMNMMRDQYGCPISDAYFALDKAITALSHPQRIRGEWIDVTKTGGAELWKCSECGELELEDSYFCPNCGADMRGDDNESN